MRKTKKMKKKNKAKEWRQRHVVDWTWKMIEE